VDQNELTTIEARVTAADQVARIPWAPFGRQVISRDQTIIAQTDDCDVSNLMSHAPGDLTLLIAEVRRLKEELDAQRLQEIVSHAWRD
jgi:hypothetical protein